MKVPTKFVTSLTEVQIETLETLWKSSENHRQRTRALAILLSDRGYTIDQIADILSVQRDTVSRWIDSWEQDAESGLEDAPRPGAPRRFEPQEEARILELLQDYPHQPKTVSALIAQETGKELTEDILRRLVHEAGYT